MRPIEGYDQTPAYTGESMQLPAGLYKCKIVQVNLVQDKKNREQMVILFDIVEGTQKDYYKDVTEEYREFYSKQFKVRKQTSDKTVWGGIYRQLTRDASLPFFKGVITSVEKSNPGYSWDWQEKGLVGKVFGGVFGREEFYAQDGEKRWATKCKQIRSLEGLKDAKVPADEPIPDSPGRSPASYSEKDGFMSIPEGADDEGIPFM